MNTLDSSTKYQELIKTIKSYNGESSLDSLHKAFEFASLAHSGQKRVSGDPYIIHSLETANILASWKLDIDSIIAGLLHDTVEDGGATKEDLIKEFGENVAFLVDGVTKVSDIRLIGSEQDEFVENLRKMFLSMAKDLRVVLIKLADRLHNMRTLSALSVDKQKKIARETLEVFAPLAERLGIGGIKGELEELSFKYLYPEDYKKVINLSKPYYKKVEKSIKVMTHKIYRTCAELGILIEIRARKKHYYSLWRKLERIGIDWDFNKIFDIIALRIFTDSVKDCYAVLGVVHRIFKPTPQLGISDFIAQPKPNGYQSIHTRVFGPDNHIVEIQIRTFKMHEEAEHGVAAHWAYSERKSKGKIIHDLVKSENIKVSVDKLQWVRQLAEWQKEIKDSGEFLEAVKFDALSHRNFIFSPKGDVYDLPKDATPIDFAAAVHSGLVGYIKSAKVNGKIVPLSYKLKSGDVCEIEKTKNYKSPTKDWLEFVRTHAAKKAIVQS